MNFKQKYLLGQCDISHIDDCAAEWHNTKTTDNNLMEHLGLTKPEYEEWLKAGNSRVLKQLFESQRRQQGFRIYQLEFDDKQATIPFAFCGIDTLRKAGYEQPPAADYCIVYDHVIICPQNHSKPEMLELIFNIYSNQLPDDYYGRSLSPSDIVELYNNEERLYFYRDTDQFVQIRFSPFLAKPLIKKNSQDK